MKRWRIVIGLIAFLAVIALVAATVVAVRSSHHVSGTVTVQPNRASHLKVGNVTVTVPTGAVRAETKLSISQPKQIPASSMGNPLNAALGTSVAFDVKFADGQQPLKPLGVEVKLSGTYLPSGNNPQRTVFYTALPQGGYELIPASVTNNVLTAQLDHLSWKILAWPDIQGWIKDALSHVFPSTVFRKRSEISGCDKQAKRSDVTVRFDGQQSGWSDSRTSGAHPCLKFDKKGRVAVEVHNNAMTFWVVASSGNSMVGVPNEDFDRGVIKVFTRIIGTPRNTKAILGRSETMTVTSDVDELPLTIQMESTPATQEAEALLGALYLVMDVFGVGDTQKIVKAFSVSKEINDCLNDGADLLRKGNAADKMFASFNLLTNGVCGAPVRKLLGRYVADNAWTWFLKKGISVLGDLKMLIENVVAGIDGLGRQFAPVTIHVTRLAPCPAGNDLANLIWQLDQHGPTDPQLGTSGGPTNVYKDVGAASNIRVDRSMCSGDWLAAGIETKFVGPNFPPGAATSDLVVLHWVGSHWELYINGGTDHSDSWGCGTLVPWVLRRFMSCRNTY